MATKAQVLTALVAATGASTVIWKRAGYNDVLDMYSQITTIGSYTIKVIPRSAILHAITITDADDGNIIDQENNLSSLYTAIETQHDAIESAAVDELYVLLT